MRQRNVITLGIALAAVFVAAALFSFWTRPPALRGHAVQPPAPAAEISLADHNGRLFRLSEQRGKVVILTFGFTNCPDECPLTMAHLREAMTLLGDQAGQVQVVMVSTDPARDTPTALRQFLASFDRGFLGLPGSRAQLEAVWRAYNVEVGEGGTTHSGLSYAIDRRGQERVTFSADTPALDVAHDLAILLSEK